MLTLIDRGREREGVCVCIDYIYPSFTHSYTSHLYPMAESTTSSAHPDAGFIPRQGWTQADHDNADLKIISSDNQIMWVSSALLAQHS